MAELVSEQDVVGADESRQRTPRAGVWLAGLIGAGTAVMAWVVLIGVFIVGLTLAMPSYMGGMGLGSESWLITYGLGAALVVGLLWLIIHLLRRSGVVRPGVVAFLGIGVAVCLFVGVLTAALQLTWGDPSSWVTLSMPVFAAVGFGSAARFSHRLGVLAVMAVVGVVVFVVARVVGTVLQ